jgi:hypothetical protein
VLFCKIVPIYVCYVDESGGFEAPDSVGGATPVMVISGLILPAARVPAFTRDFLALKRTHFPGRFTAGHGLSHILIEIKGSEILQMTRSGSRNKRRQAKIFRAGLMALIEGHGARLLAWVWVKESGKGMDPVSSYSFAIQDIAHHVSVFCASQGSQGILVCDAREHTQNVAAAHSVFTDKFRTGADPVAAVSEIPLFAHSENHAGLQACDLVATTLLFPMAAAAYCTVPPGPGLFRGPHESPQYDTAVRQPFGAAVRKLQFRYVDENGKWKGGVVVSDGIGKQPGSVLFG